MENGANGTTKTTIKELISIFVNCFPDYEGPRVQTDKRVGDGIHKYTLSLPAPREEETHNEIYGEHFSFDQCIDNGNRQRAYDDGNAVKNACDEHIIQGQLDPNDEEMIDLIRETAEEAMKREATRKVGGAAKVERAAGKKVNSAAAELGMSLDEMIAKAKAMQELEAAQAEA